MPSYEKNKKNNTWSVRFRDTDPDTGLSKNMRLSRDDRGPFKTKKDAQYAYEDYQARRKQEQAEKKVAVVVDPGDMIFDVLIEKYLEFKKPRIKETSVYDVEKKLKKRILPFFSGMKVKDITPTKVIEWQNTLIREYSYAYQKTLMTHLCMVFKFAEKYHNIPNKIRDVDRPRNLEPKKEMLFWSPDEFSKFIKCVERTDYGMFFRFLYLSGCRLGEALALSWSDFDFDSCTVSVSKSVTRKARDEGKTYKITTPKNETSTRKIALPPFLMRRLQAYKEEQGSLPFAFGGIKPFASTSVARQVAEAAAAAGVKRIRVHDFRHSCASLLISKGVSIVAVSKHLGHKDVKQTLNTYAHMLPDDNAMILNAFGTVEGNLEL